MHALYREMHPKANPSYMPLGEETSVGELSFQRNVVVLECPLAHEADLRRDDPIKN